MAATPGKVSLVGAGIAGEKVFVLRLIKGA
jgi:hypothetical protein